VLKTWKIVFKFASKQIFIEHRMNNAKILLHKSKNDVASLCQLRGNMMQRMQLRGAPPSAYVASESDATALLASDEGDWAFCFVCGPS